MTEIWDEARLHQLIVNEVEENLNLDYKAADSLDSSDRKKKEIVKDVSAMANSDGGRIIYGIAEYQDELRKHLPEKIDPVQRSNFSKERLEQIINSGIHPRISGVIIYPITIGGSNEQVVYIVEIPKSNTAHQNSKDHRYYKRFNFESIPMQDYEIRDVMNRAIHPDVGVIFSYERAFHTSFELYQLRILIKNKGATAVQNFKLEFSFPILHQIKAEWKRSSSDSEFMGLTQRNPEILVRTDQKYPPRFKFVYRSKDTTLFPDDEIDLSEVFRVKYGFHRDVLHPNDQIFSKLGVRWTLYADDMPKKIGEVGMKYLCRY